MSFDMYNLVYMSLTSFESPGKLLMPLLGGKIVSVPFEMILALKNSQ